MQSKVPKGLATWAGLIAAAGQYALSLALFLDSFDQTDPVSGIAPLVTATATLWKVIEGRMRQAQTLARVDAAKAIRPAPVATYQRPQSAGSGARVMSTWREPRPGAEVQTGVDEDAPDLSVQPPDPTIADPELDDPGYEPPSRETHSRLKG